MDKARLKATRRTLQNYVVFGAPDIGTEDAIDMIALIDSALAEPERDCNFCVGCECEPPLNATVKDCKAYLKRQPDKIEPKSYETVQAIGLIQNMIRTTALNPLAIRALTFAILALEQYSPELLAEPDDAAVREAIEHFNSCLKYRKEQEEETKKHYGGELPSWHKGANKHEATAIAALRAYQNPTDEAVQRAVTKLMDWNRESTGGECDCEKCEALRLVCDAALRQMQVEPPCEAKIRYSICSGWCEWCGYEIDLDYNWKHCPNCGRKLVK